MLNTSSGSSSLEAKPSLMQELRSFDNGGFSDLGHPLLNRIAESFVKAAGIGALQAVSREAYFTATEGFDSSTNGIPPEISLLGNKKKRFPDLRGENNRKSLEAMVKNTGKESLQWGLAAGVYSGLTYGLAEARGAHDWKNSAVAEQLQEWPWPSRRRVLPMSRLCMALSPELPYQPLQIFFLGYFRLLIGIICSPAFFFFFLDNVEMRLYCHPSLV
ncbi:outer envelope pore protein 16-2 [Pyrus ussuriensis x Pyrus communis]|uniref:Outer envelope pore protein 16-2 n=1 Tax=Pyrus ussuriensis x Pyrus communis TaxID=2448454 RepID=A0A5N5HPH9_9ROSA|nr:outer envelope pore protein 16-2 [Pyrus ussuriensis x Pyrus communis]